MSVTASFAKNLVAVRLAYVFISQGRSNIIRVSECFPFKLFGICSCARLQLGVQVLASVFVTARRPSPLEHALLHGVNAWL